MKLAIKIFNWITICFCLLAIVFSIVMALLFGLRFNQEKDLVMFIMFIAFFLFYSLLLLVPLTVCAISNYYLKKAHFRKDVKIIGVITLLFGNPISGILLLCLDDEDFFK